MKAFIRNTDPVYREPAKFSALDSFFIRFIRDPRDLPFVHLTLRITFIMIPLGILLFMPFVQGWLWWVIAAVYTFLNNVRFKGPFGLMFHCTNHRIFFKKDYNALNYYLPWFVGPFFGQTPETYFSHHIGMHHAENNLPNDKSTTMPYKRDSIKGFGKYLGSFFVMGLVELSQYFISKKRRKLMYKALGGEAAFFMLCAALCFVNWQATLVVFILPFFIFRTITMMGNWAQHSFVDASDPGNEYRNSVTCINTNYNHKCWNDGYHISHHEKPAMHWSEHPIWFWRTLDRYVANDAIVFDGIHFMHVFIYLMFNRYDKLAEHFVNLGGRYASDDEVMAMLRSRVQRIAVDTTPEALAS